MRIHRIVLRNFEGVSESEVVLPTSGVTIIEGPNEAGKSSLVRGMDLLFQYPQESKHARVLAACPVHTSAGPEVELEVTTGHYRVVFWKRWRTRPDTRLTVIAPSRETLSGRQAHDRMTAILEETLDRPLFQALRFIQGSQVGQGQVGTSTTLIAALDRAAAGGIADPQSESSLWEAIDEERRRYFTPNGKISGERQKLIEQLEGAEQAVAQAERLLVELEETGDTYKDVVVAAEIMKARQQSAASELSQSRRASSEIDEIEANLQTLLARNDAAQANVTIADRALTARQEMIAGIIELGEQCRRLGESMGDEEDRLAAAVDSLQASRKDAEEAEGELSSASSHLELANEDAKYHRSVVSDRLFTARLRRLQESRALEMAARRVLDSNLVTKDARELVEHAWNQSRQAQIMLELGRPSVNLRAQSEIQLAIDGVPLQMAGGTTHEVSVASDIEIEHAGYLTVIIRGAASQDDLQRQADAARSELGSFVARYGLDPADPITDLGNKLLEVGNAEADVKRAEQLRSDALDDLSEAELAAKAENARALACHYPTVRTGELPMPADPGEAEAAVRTALARNDAAVTRVNEARQRTGSVQAAVSAQKIEVARTREQLRGSTETLVRLTGQLEEARASSSDVDLVSRFEDASRDAVSALARQKELNDQLQIRSPDTARLRLQNAAELSNRLSDEQGALEARRIQLKTLLEERGAAALQEAIDQAVTVRTELRSRTDEVERRADAALLLFETFGRHRDQARLAYIAPYRAEIERLAKLVFGTGTSVEVDPEDFSILSRTVDGRTIGYDSLSTGAKEQLAVLARLACAILVNSEGGEDEAGVPVILDDALGNTDPERLRSLAPAFSAAAKRAQVIVLASSPDRFAMVGDAKVIRIAHSPF